jgi:Zn-dependent peptidase ImmA (M78 family)
MPTMPQEQAINQLARRYQVSRFVVLGRMQTLGAISSQTYQHFAQRWKRRERPASARIQRGGPTATTRCLSQKGRPFVSLVLQAAKRDVITINDAASYLGIKLKDFRKLAAQVP